MGYIYLILLNPFVFYCGGFDGVGSVIMDGLNCDERLDALSVPPFFTLGAGSISHRLISFFSIFLNSFCKAAHLPLLIYLIGNACAGFPKKNPILETAL